MIFVSTLSAPNGNSTEAKSSVLFCIIRRWDCRLPAENGAQSRIDFNCYKETGNAKYFHFYSVLKILIKILSYVRLSFHMNNFGLFIIFFLAQTLQFTFEFRIKETKVIIE